MAGGQTTRVGIGYGGGTMVDDFLDARTAALAGLFDNAAVFPPASHSLADAVVCHRGHRDGHRSWLVRRLLIRASDAAQLPDLLSDTDDVELGVVLDRAREGSFADAVAADLASLAPLTHDRRVRLTGLELALGTADPEEDIAALSACLDEINTDEIGPDGIDLAQGVVIAVEVPVAGRSAGDVLRGLAAVAGGKRPGSRDTGGFVAKIRCGGVVASAVPADVEVAGFLQACSRNRLAFKATAGLHHPTRGRNSDHGGTEHGFLNLIAASVAAFQGAKLQVIQTHLSRPAEDFKLGPGAMIVGDDVVEATLLDHVRRQFLTGIGCCDIIDPITDLARMGVVEPTGGLA